jgi:transcription antitermination factor NusG
MDKTPFLQEYNSFQPGMKVRILVGPFKEFRGKILAVNQTAQSVKIAINFFGVREVDAEYDYSQIAPDW